MAAFLVVEVAVSPEVAAVVVAVAAAVVDFLEGVEAASLAVGEDFRVEEVAAASQEGAVSPGRRQHFVALPGAGHPRV